MSVRKQILVDEADLKWFEEEYPGAELTWIFGILFHNFRLSSHSQFKEIVNRTINCSVEQVKEE